jgi:hypothetical protein
MYCDSHQEVLIELITTAAMMLTGFVSQEEGCFTLLRRKKDLTACILVSQMEKPTGTINIWFVTIAYLPILV